MVGGRPLHLYALSAAPEVAAAYDQRNLYAHIPYRLYLVDYAGDYVFVYSVSVLACKCLARKLYEHSFVFGLHTPTSRLFFY